MFLEGSGPDRTLKEEGSGIQNEVVKEEMVLISELDTPLSFLASICNDMRGSQLGGGE